MKAKGQNHVKEGSNPQSAYVKQPVDSAPVDWEKMGSPNFCLFYLIPRLFRPSVDEITNGLKVLSAIDIHLNELTAKAKQGDSASLKELFYTAYQSTAAIQEVVENSLDHVRQVSKKVPVWPVLAYKSASKNSAQQDIFKSLELGTEVQVCDASLMFRRPTTFKNCAFTLLTTIVQMRNSLKYQKHLQTHQRSFLVQTDKNKTISISSTLLEVVDTLPDFSSSQPQFTLWCKAVVCLLIEVTGDRYHENPILWKEVETMVRDKARNDGFPLESNKAINCARGEILNRLRKAIKVAAQTY